MGKSPAAPQNMREYQGLRLGPLVNEAWCLDGRFEQTGKRAYFQHVDPGRNLENRLDACGHFGGDRIGVITAPDLDT
ncbi:MAG: hypothetical protein ACI9MU_000608, partial [Alphaproteobacteria bacterium]